jgi:phosphate transport system substrate-binding protein
VFGFSFLEENTDKLKGVPIDGVAPTYTTITDFTYPGARPLYIYVKSAHLKSIKGLREFAGEFAAAWGPDGYLKKQGMVIAPDAVRTANAEVVATMKPLDSTQLK